MRIRRLCTIALATFAAGGALWAQDRGGGAEWLTSHGDAQGTSWIRDDAAISVESMSKPGFALQWKLALDSQPLNTLSQGVTANGVTLFVPMSLVAGRSNTIYAIDNEIGYTVWQRHFDLPLPAATSACPGGMTAAATRIVDLEPPPLPTGGPSPGLRGRGRGYYGVVGEPDEGVPIEARRRGPPPTRQTTPGRAGAQAGRGAAAGRGAGGRGANGAPGRGGRETPPGIPGAPPGAPSSGYGRPAGVVYAITSDGILHVLGLPSGEDIQKPARFLPANARWSNPIAVKTTLYASTSHACGSAPSGIWAIDLASPAKPVVSWQTKGGDLVGSPVFTTDGTLIAAVGPGTAGPGGFANAIVALDPATLKPTDWFTDPAIEFASSPLVLTHEGKDIVAVATADGRILLLDAHALGGANHATPLYSSPWLTEARSGFAPGALAAWQEAVPADASTPGAPGAARAVQPGTNWLLVPVAGPLASGAPWPLTKGAITHGAVVALKVVDDGGRVALQPGWVSRDLASPVTPLIVHGVVFAVSSGKPAGASATEVAQHASPAVLYAMNGTDGAEFWNSGTTMSSFLPGDSFWSATGQVYVGTNDGNLYAFGFAMERH